MGRRDYAPPTQPYPPATPAKAPGAPMPQPVPPPAPQPSAKRTERMARKGYNQ